MVEKRGYALLDNPNCLITGLILHYSDYNVLSLFIFYSLMKGRFNHFIL